jgi:signal transduction histidine kinase
MALQSDQNGEVQREALAECIEESEQILTMLNTLMDISEAETGAMKLEPKELNVPELMEDVVDLYRYVAEDKGIALHIECPKGLCLTADPTRMRQVLANLLDNAIKYTPKGGEVFLEAHQKDRQVMLIMRDTGIGIPQEELPRIWDRLYRGDQSRSQKGLGLGLSFVRAIALAHKGRVEVSSEPGKGSVFTVILPADGSFPP